MAVPFSFLLAKPKRVLVAFIRCQLQPPLPQQSSNRSVLIRLNNQMTEVKSEAKIYVAMLVACMMIDPMPWALLPFQRATFFALVQVDPNSIFFTVSSAHGKKKAQRSERQGRRARALIPSCTGPAWCQWNYTSIKHKQHKPESAPRCALIVCLLRICQDIITSLTYVGGRVCVGVG